MPRSLVASSRAWGGVLAVGLLLAGSSCLSSYSQRAQVYLCNNTTSLVLVSFRVPQNLDTVWWIGGRQVGQRIIGAFVARGVQLQLEGYSPSNQCLRAFPAGSYAPLPGRVFLRTTIDTVFRSRRRLLDTAIVKSERPDSLWSPHSVSRRFTTLYYRLQRSRERLSRPLAPCELVDWQPDSTGFIRITIQLRPHDRLMIAEHYSGLHVSDPVRNYGSYFAPQALSVNWLTASGPRHKSFKTQKLLDDLLAQASYSPTSHNSFEVVDSVVCD